MQRQEQLARNSSHFHSHFSAPSNQSVCSYGPDQTVSSILFSCRRLHALDFYLTAPTPTLMRYFPWVQLYLPIVLPINSPQPVSRYHVSNHISVIFVQE